MLLGKLLVIIVSTYFSRVQCFGLGVFVYFFCHLQTEILQMGDHSDIRLLQCFLFRSGFYHHQNIIF